MLTPFPDRHRVWVEVSTDPAHGGSGWEFGTCLWSPVTNRSGARRYQVMEQPARNDIVLHFRAEDRGDTALRAWSRVSSPARVTREEPPHAGDWSDRGNYYRIELMDFKYLKNEVPLEDLLVQFGDEIRDEIQTDRPSFYPITTHGQSLRTVQGIYLAECTRRLYSLILMALEASALEPLPQSPIAPALFREGRERWSETRSFVRDPRLVKLAKMRADGFCECCGLDTRSLDPEIGHSVLECHHNDPLATRDIRDSETSLVDVTVVCANCHRLLHARAPILHPDELRRILL